MNPQQPNPIQPVNYDFIMQSSSQPPRFSQGGRKQRIVFVAVGALLLLTLVILFFSFVTSQGKKGTAELIDLASYQTEMSRIISLGIEGSKDSTVKARATTAKYSFQSDLSQVKTILKSKNIQPKAEELAKYKTPSIDQQFETAKRANNFDEVYTQLIDEKLENYKKKLSEVFNTQSSESVKNALRNFNAHAVLLASNYSSAATQ